MTPIVAIDSGEGDDLAVNDHFEDARRRLAVDQPPVPSQPKVAGETLFQAGTSQLEPSATCP